MQPSTRATRPAPHRARQTDLPPSPMLAATELRMDFADAFEISRPAGSSEDPQVWADRLFRSAPPGVGALMAVRDLVVGLIGIERGTSDVFTTTARDDREVLLGVDQGHLSFRSTVLVETDRVVLSTVVDLHNRRGVAYWAIVERVHPFVIRAMLNRAARSFRSPR